MPLGTNKASHSSIVNRGLGIVLLHNSNRIFFQRISIGTSCLFYSSLAFDSDTIPNFFIDRTRTGTKLVLRNSNSNFQLPLFPFWLSRDSPKIHLSPRN